VNGDCRTCSLGDQGNLDELIVSVGDERRRIAYSIRESPFGFEHHNKTGGEDPGSGSTRPEQIDAMDYVARVLAQIPPPRKYLVRYHGYYSNAARGKRRRDQNSRVARTDADLEQQASPPAAAAALRSGWRSGRRGWCGAIPGLGCGRSCGRATRADRGPRSFSPATGSCGSGTGRPCGRRGTRAS
jgi:hypothetical protein